MLANVLRWLRRLEARIEDLELREAGGTWIAPTFENSWVNYDTANYNPAGYWRDADGVVHLRGLVKDGTIGQTIFTLPTGYRPPQTEIIVVISNSSLGQLRILTSGSVQAYAGSNVWFSLDGITFRASGYE